MTFPKAFSKIVDLLESDQLGKQLNDYYAELVSTTARESFDSGSILSVLRRLCKCAQRHLCNKIEEPHKKVLALYQKLLQAIEERVQPSIDLWKSSRELPDSTCSLCLHLLILGTLSGEVPVNDTIDAINAFVNTSSTLSEKPLPWLCSSLCAFSNFPFESVAALILRLGHFDQLWTWTTSNKGTHFYLSLQLHSILHSHRSNQFSNYMKALEDVIESCGASNCTFHPLKRRAMICYGLAGGAPTTLAMTHPHTKHWLQCGPGPALLRSPQLKEALLGGGMQYLVTERLKVVAILEGCGLVMTDVLSEANLKKQMKVETNYETVFKLFSICYLEKCEALDKQLLKGLILFGEKTVKSGNCNLSRIVAALSAEVVRRKDTALDLTRLVSITGAMVSDPQLSSLDLCSGIDVAQLRGVLTELCGEGELSPRKRRRISDEVKSAVSSIGIKICTFLCFFKEGLMEPTCFLYKSEPFIPAGCVAQGTINHCTGFNCATFNTFACTRNAAADLPSGFYLYPRMYGFDCRAFQISQICDKYRLTYDFI